MNKSKYIKVASYEAKKGDIKKVLLLYSGGLDTSVMLKWILDHYKAEVITLTLDLGQQHDDLKVIQNKALSFGAAKAITLDVKNEFAEEYLSKGILANARYQGDYHLSTPIGRAVIAKKAVEMAKKTGADCIAHGCTGKGNDQVRLEGYILTHEPQIKIIAYSMGSLLNLVILLVILDNKTGGFHRKKQIKTFLKVGVASLLMAFALYIPIKLLDQLVFDTTRTINLIFLTGISSAIGLSLYLLLTWLFDVKEAKTYLLIFKKLGNWKEILGISDETIDGTRVNP